MKDSLHKLEAGLKRLQPRAATPQLRERIAAALEATAPDVSHPQPARARRSARWAAATLAVAAAAVLFVVVSPWIDWHGPKGDSRVQQPEQMESASWTDEIDTTPALAVVSRSPEYRLAELSLPPLAMRVACASAILRGRMQELTGTCVVYKVTKVLYGRVGHTVVSVDCQGLPSVALARRNLADRLRREPKEAEVQAEIAKAVHFERSREAIAFLEECRKTEHGLVGRMLSPAHIGSPRFTLDDLEGQIIEVIRTGANLKVPEGNLHEYLRGAERVLRGELTRLTDTSAEWKVLGNLYVGSQDHEGTHGGIPESAGQPGKIAIGLDPWRLRAEALVRYRTPGGPDQWPDENETQDLFVRLVKTELRIGEHAILFVKSRHRANEAGKYKLVGLLASDPTRPQQLEECDARIRKMIEKADNSTPRP